MRRPVYFYILGVLYMMCKHYFENIINISRHVLQFLFFLSFFFRSGICHVLGFGWHRVSLETSHCRSVSFCTELCVVSALNSKAV